ncbi:TRAP transporter substrate-binding protein DctP [candidate division KSB1 bacterium]|nr:TRAP transporter substrate-binding protein DctP [candidate division KSB1 bacterium]
MGVRMKRFLWLIVMILICSRIEAQVYTIKFASLAPDGSTWMNVMREFDAAIREETNGDLGFKIYPGGVSGDEKDVMRKIRLGQLQSAGFTGVGLGEILPEVRILDSPFLFRNHDEIDYINEKFYNKFAADFERQGYVLLGWAEVGFVYVFTRTPVRSLNDMKSVKMWMWEGDPVAEATFKSLGVGAIPMSVINVMTALQTGMVNGVYTSPLAAISLQWFTQVKYMMEFPLANSSGAVLISKRSFEKLPLEYRDVLMSNAKKYLGKLTRLSREDNFKSIESLRKNGIEILPAPTQDMLDLFVEKGQDARRILADNLFGMEIVDEVEAALVEYRNAERQENKK